MIRICFSRSALNFEFRARPNLPGRWFLKQRELARLGCWTTCVTKMRSQSLRVPAKKWDSVVWHGLGTSNWDSNGDANAEFPLQTKLQKHACASSYWQWMTNLYCHCQLILYSRGSEFKIYTGASFKHHAGEPSCNNNKSNSHVIYVISISYIMHVDV